MGAVGRAVASTFAITGKTSSADSADGTMPGKIADQRDHSLGGLAHRHQDASSSALRIEAGREQHRPTCIDVLDVDREIPRLFCTSTRRDFPETSRTSKLPCARCPKRFGQSFVKCPRIWALGVVPHTQGASIGARLASVEGC